jgi:hypothetical protein
VCARVRSGFIWFNGSMAGSCEHGGERRFHKIWGFLTSLTTISFLRWTDAAPWISTEGLPLKSEGTCHYHCLEANCVLNQFKTVTVLVILSFYVFLSSSGYMPIQQTYHKVVYDHFLSYSFFIITLPSGCV